MKQHLNTIIIAAAVVITGLFFANTYKNRNRTNDVISVTGLGAKDFKSDLIIWRGSFSTNDMDPKIASANLEKDRLAIQKYLKSKNIQEKEIVFSAINLNPINNVWYDDDGHEHSEFKGYLLSQDVTIESHEVEKVEELSRSITELINEGIFINSSAPEYYYTKLSELKIEMVAAATEDARVRAEQIAKNSNATLGHLRFAQMGVFQIVAQNSNDDYGWGGSFDTGSKMKTANITMKLQFGIE